MVGFPGCAVVKNPPAMQDTWVWSLGQEVPLQKEMAAHSSTLAWGIPWTEEPGGIQSMGLQKSWTHTNQLHTHTHTHTHTIYTHAYIYIYMNMYLSILLKNCYFQVTLCNGSIKEIASSAFCYWERLNKEEKLLLGPIYRVCFCEREQKTHRITFDLNEYFTHHTDYIFHP